MDESTLDLAKTLMASAGALWGFYGATLLAVLKYFVVDRIRPPAGVAKLVVWAIILFIGVNFLAVVLFQFAAGVLLTDLLGPKFCGLAAAILPAMVVLAFGHFALGVATVMGVGKALKDMPPTPT